MGLSHCARGIKRTHVRNSESDLRAGRKLGVPREGTYWWREMKPRKGDVSQQTATPTEVHPRERTGRLGSAPGKVRTRAHTPFRLSAGGFAHHREASQLCGAGLSAVTVPLGCRVNDLPRLICFRHRGRTAVFLFPNRPLPATGPTGSVLHSFS